MRRIAALALIVPLILPCAAFGGKKKDHEDGLRVAITFTDDDRETACLYFVEKHGRGN